MVRARFDLSLVDEMRYLTDECTKVHSSGISAYLYRDHVLTGHILDWFQKKRITRRVVAERSAFDLPWQHHRPPRVWNCCRYEYPSKIFQVQTGLLKLAKKLARINSYKSHPRLSLFLLRFLRKRNLSDRMISRAFEAGPRDNKSNAK